MAVSHLAASRWTQALGQLLIIHIHIDPLLFAVPWHPVRVVHNLILAKLLLHLSALAAIKPDSVAALSEYQLDYSVSVTTILKDVEMNISISHGPETKLAEHFTEAKEREWVKLRRIAEVALG
ncbi:MAG: hypothetical protein M1832_002043 [Thelocarpon impressellum]|nr:MAG: hypothetical protein M1832_002043 [Thelocarpon impressellum]